MNPFNGYKVYGPTWHKRIGRYMIFLVSPTHRTSMTYARYLMCMDQGRWLEPHEHVDHIDNNRTNDVIENLQILTPAANAAKRNALLPDPEMVSLVCPQCGDPFERQRRQVAWRTSPHPPCCSRECGYKQGAATRAAQPVDPGSRRTVGEIVHGTRAGYQKELRRGLPTCDACRAANAERTRQRNPRLSS